MVNLDAQGKKLILTEAERLQRREETARRRKRQSEQRLQDEQVGQRHDRSIRHLAHPTSRPNRSSELILHLLQDSTINRLLRAQTGRSRAKLDGPSPVPSSDPVQSTSAETQYISSSRRRQPLPKNGMIRWVSSMSGDDVILRVGLPIEKETWLAGRTGNEKVDQRDMSGICGVAGCEESRKYRSTRRFEVGGCCLQHLKAVEAGFDR